MPERFLDVSHEALIRGWPRLRGWLDEDRAGLRIQRRITETAEEWQRSNRDDDLLYRGARLIQAQEWRARHEAEGLEGRWFKRRTTLTEAGGHTPSLVGGLPDVPTTPIAGTIVVQGSRDRDQSQLVRYRHGPARAILCTRSVYGQNVPIPTSPRLRFLVLDGAHRNVVRRGFYRAFQRNDWI